MHVFHFEKKKIVHDEDSHTIRLFIAWNGNKNKINKMQLKSMITSPPLI